MYNHPERNNNSTGIAIALLSLIGTIITAYFAYRSSVGPTEISIGATRTAEAASARATAIMYAAEKTVAVQFSKTSTPDFPHVVIENRLLRPVRIFIENTYKNS